MRNLPLIPAPGVHRAALLTWVGVYPVLTLIAWALAPVIGGASLPLRTLVMSAIMVPVMVYLVMPAMARFNTPD